MSCSICNIKITDVIKCPTCINNTKKKKITPKLVLEFINKKMNTNIILEEIIIEINKT